MKKELKAPREVDGKSSAFQEYDDEGQVGRDAN